jgi:hypothetical protein
VGPVVALAAAQLELMTYPRSIDDGVSVPAGGASGEVRVAMPACSWAT